MKIKTSFIKQIIKEEIRKALYGDPIKQKVIHLFAKARDGMDDPANKQDFIRELAHSLDIIGVMPNKAIDLLNPEEVDQNFYIRCCEIHNELIKLPDVGGEEKRINAFAHFPRIDHDPNIDQDPEFMRKPKNAEAYDQEDTRKERDNLIQP